MDSGCTSGGILKLRELIEEHPAELAYDLRSKCGVSIDHIGSTVSYREAILLVSVLMRMSDSWLQSVSSGWDYPVSREWIVSAHIYDLTAAVNSGKGKKPKPYPNPFPNTNQVRTGRTDRSPAEVRELLERMNPKES